MKGYTKKPCHGCGEIPRHYGGREVDKVCGDCLKLLKDAREARRSLQDAMLSVDGYVH